MYSLGYAVPRTNGVTNNNYLLPTAVHDCIFDVSKHSIYDQKGFSGKPITIFYQGGFPIESLREWYGLTDETIADIEPLIYESKVTPGKMMIRSRGRLLNGISEPVFFMPIEIYHHNYIANELRSLRHLPEDKTFQGRNKVEHFASKEEFAKHRYTIRTMPTYYISDLITTDIVIPAELSTSTDQGYWLLTPSALGYPKQTQNIHHHSSKEPLMYDDSRVRIFLL